MLSPTPAAPATFLGRIQTATTSGLTVSLPNGQTILTAHPALLPFLNLPLAVRQDYVFPALQNRSLLSTGQLFDHGLRVAFYKEQVQFLDSKSKITGIHDH